MIELQRLREEDRGKALSYMAEGSAELLEEAIHAGHSVLLLIGDKRWTSKSDNNFSGKTAYWTDYMKPEPYIASLDSRRRLVTIDEIQKNVKPDCAESWDTNTNTWESVWPSGVWSDSLHYSIPKDFELKPKEDVKLTSPREILEHIKTTRRCSDVSCDGRTRSNRGTPCPLKVKNCLSQEVEYAEAALVELDKQEQHLFNLFEIDWTGAYPKVLDMAGGIELAKGLSIAGYRIAGYTNNENWAKYNPLEREFCDYINGTFWKARFAVGLADAQA